MSYEFYKVMHFMGIFTIFLGLGAQFLHFITSPSRDYPQRKLIGASHGIGMFLTLVGGFGLLARLGVGFPGWVYAKLAIWLCLGGVGALVSRKPELAKPLWFIVILLGATAGFVALTKPF